MGSISVRSSYIYSGAKLFSGVTNKILSKKAKAVFTAYPGMESFFPNTEVRFLGNPIRQNIIDDKLAPEVAKEN